MVRIVATSDLHGQLPKKMPEGDILVIAGDSFPVKDHQHHFQRNWLKEVFVPFLANQIYAEKYKHILWIAGNHDLICQLSGFRRLWEKSMYGDALKNIHYLQDEAIKIEELNFYGYPWVPPIWGAFNCEDGIRMEKIDEISSDIDILISHGPPYAILDRARSGNVGCQLLANQLFYRIQPRLVIMGHIHEAYGTNKINNIEFANVSRLDEFYHARTKQQPMVFDIYPSS